MTLDSNIVSAFTINGFHLSRSTNYNHVYRINESGELSTLQASKIIAAVHYCSIISENRQDRDLEFTVVPYKKGLHFDRFEFRKKEMNEEDLWKEIEATKCLMGKENDPVVVDGEVVFPRLSEVKIHMSLNCTQIAPIVVEFLSEVPKTGTLLDLGCGVGANSKPFLQKGWKVVAVDVCSKALDVYRQQCKEYLTDGRLHLIEGDLTEYELESNQFDLVIGVDVLPYIPSKKLRVLMEKIHQSLKKDGRFLGSLFFSNYKEFTFSQKCSSQLGAHFYLGDYIAPTLLEHSGFQIERCSPRLERCSPRFKQETTCALFSAIRL